MAGIPSYHWNKYFGNDTYEKCLPFVNCTHFALFNSDCHHKMPSLIWLDQAKLQLFKSQFVSVLIDYCLVKTGQGRYYRNLRGLSVPKLVFGEN